MRTCMGGWCDKWREVCVRYQPGTQLKASAERLCGKGGREYYLPFVPAAAVVRNPTNGRGGHPLQR